MRSRAVLVILILILTIITNGFAKENKTELNLLITNKTKITSQKTDSVKRDLVWKTPDWDQFVSAPSKVFQIRSQKKDSNARLVVQSVPRNKYSVLTAFIKEDALIIQAKPKRLDDYKIIQILEYGLDPKVISDDQFSCFSTFTGPRGAKANFYYEGTDHSGKHFYKLLKIAFNGRRQIIPFTQIIPGG